jgi:dTDP-4-dehydrorhamnose reductase
MRILILGASGLIGHKLWEVLGRRFDDVHCALHGSRAPLAKFELFNGSNVHEHFAVEDWTTVATLLEKVKPNVVLNCAGITKRRPVVNDAIHAISVNALTPHLLARWAGENGARIIHFSTDCVFDGKDGPYTEQSPTTGKDAYGQTKALGEIRYDHCLTIRSSFIGRELSVHSELLDWLLTQNGKTVKGFSQAWYSGISTLEMARIVGDIIEHQPGINGLHQLSTLQPINKYDLLCVARDAFKLDIEIVPDPSFVTFPTLDSSLLRSKMKIDIPTWPEMIAALAADSTPYPKLPL